MFLKDLHKTKKTSISFEVFPPNEKYNLDTIYTTIEELKDLNPDYISVTYGAGGSTSKRTLEISSALKNKYEIEALAHLTCIGATKEKIDLLLEDFKKNNVKNILALRGDLPQGADESLRNEGDFFYASDLVSYIKSKGDFSIGGAFYPESHIENNDIQDLIYLKKKVDMGTDFLISQVFFDNDKFYSFRDNAEKIGINVPLILGIMPVLNAKQIKKIVSLCNCSVPKKLERILEKYEHSPEALKDAGIAYATEQVIELLTNGVDGLHFYTMNKAFASKKILSNIEHIIEDINK